MADIESLNTRAHLLTAISAAIKAGTKIIEIYNQNFSVEIKQDNSPLTAADKSSHEIIVSCLEPSDIPILSEEGKHLDFSIRKNWERLWIIDPLDGTKEFIKRNGEFTVNIALVESHAPVLGVIYVPAFSLLYFAARNFGAYKIKLDGLAQTENKTLDDYIGQVDLIKVDKTGTRPFTIVGSRSHATPEMEDYVRAKEKKHKVVHFIPAGSSLKFCRVAEGSADIYPRLGTTMEWDTAAGHVIAEQAGAHVFAYHDRLPLVYNKEDFRNPWFIVSNTRDDF